jgi:putative peptidoglycan lipid II flippase
MSEIASVLSVERQDKRNITIAAFIQGIFTLISRVAGMIRDVMVSHFFGATIITDAFNMAFTIPNVLRRFSGEGGFAVVFVPVFFATQKNNNQHDAKIFYRDAFGLLLITLSVITTLGILFSSSLVGLFAAGFINNPEQFELTNSMTKWLFPYVFLVSLVALFGSYLQCYRRFAAMAAAPIMFNFGMIAAMLWTQHYFTLPILSLVLGVLIGGLLQVLMMVWALKQADLWAWPRFNFKTSAMTRMLKLLGPALFGVLVYQLNIVVLRQFASFLSEGQITYYYNADRLTQFATGIFGVSIATAALPELSRGIAQFGEQAFFNTLRFTLSITSFVITPCALGLSIFAFPIVSVLYFHGIYSAEDVAMTAKTLMAFAPSLIPFSLSRPLIQSFYAQNNTKTPVLIGIVTLFINLIFGFILVRFNVVGLALTLSISSCFQYALLLIFFKRVCISKFKTYLFKPFIFHVGITIMACIAGLIVQLLGDWELGFTIKNALILGLTAAVAGFTYLGLSWYFNIPEAKKLVEAVYLRFFNR